jgi:hypothetical protein
MDTQGSTAPINNRQGPRRLDWLHVTLLLLLAVVITAVLSVWVARTFLFPSEFEPVSLSERENSALESKLERLEGVAASAPPVSAATPVENLPEGQLEPETYSEAGADREVSLNERELNALLARNPDMARRLAIDLSENLISAKLLVPVDPDFPLFAGKIIRVRAGVEVALEQGRPVVILRGLSIMGVPLPNAWLGGLKNIDLVREFGAEPGFWRAFAAGVEDLQVVDGALRIKLRE